MIKLYQRVTLVNLVNHKGHELPVKEAFERGMINAQAADPTIASAAQYVYFDFHTECKNMRFDRVSILIDRLAPTIQDMGWYHSIGGSQVISRQSGVVRSNCMDCLDRTNVMQAALGRWVLDKQLRAAGILSHKEGVEDHPEFMNTFRNGQLEFIPSHRRSSHETVNTRDYLTESAVWADHGDTVSRAYAGTAALKSDYTRTGQRSREGALQDGYKSIMRYIKNNFFDGDRQVFLQSFAHFGAGLTRAVGCIWYPNWCLGCQERRHSAFDRYTTIGHAISKFRHPEACCMAMSWSHHTDAVCTGFRYDNDCRCYDPSPYIW